MIKLIKIIFSLVLILYLFTFVSAQSNSTHVSVQNGRSVNDEGRRRKRFQFGHQIWWWGLKALSVLITVKIKIILLVLFIGGGIFYGLKVWQGSALGCPEPIISEIKHHDIHDILPYHGQLSSGGYDSPPPGYSGFDYSSVYSNTPASFSSGYSTQGGSSVILGTSGSGDDASSGPPPSNTYLPPSNRRNAYTGRALSESQASMFSDLMFRFLGVKTESCKRRFICELDFRNPFMSYALNYIGNDVFKHYRLDKESPKYPKQFADCSRLYSDCEIPKEGYSTKKRRRYFPKKRNQTATEEETTTNSSIETVDLVTKYVKDQEK